MVRDEVLPALARLLVEVLGGITAHLPEDLDEVGDDVLVLGHLTNPPPGVGRQISPGNLSAK